jgi:Putative peptidoglycan binding domain
MGLHLFGVTDKDVVFHTILPETVPPDHGAFGDVSVMTERDRPWRDDPTDPARPPVVLDTACATDSDGNLHVLVVSSNGRLWHIRRDRTRVWSEFGDVEKGGAGQIGTVTAVAAATEGTALHILAANSSKELHETVWNPPTPSGEPASFNPRFRKVGTWNPANGKLHALAAAEFFLLPEGTVRVVLDGVPVLREPGGAAPDRRVARLQQMLNLAGFGATPTTGSGLLSETGVYDAATAAAVRRFQQAKGLPQNGIMNGATWKAFLTHWLSGQ